MNNIPSSLQGNQANASTALKSVLGTVNSVATAVGSTFDIVTSGVGMAHNFVENASIRQNQRSTIESHIYLRELKAESGLRVMRLNDSVREFVGSDENRQAEWKSIEAELDALFTD